jgi:hypothetical protein
MVLFASLALVLSGVLSAQAQTATPESYSAGLPPGFAKSGMLLKLDDSISLSFTVPALTDMVIEVTADKVVIVRTCVEIEGPAICPPGGGGDGDPPTNYSMYIPSRDAAQTIDVSLRRPLDSEVHYQLTTHAVVAQGLGLDESRTVSGASADVPSMSYALHVNPAQPFVIQVEDTRTNGDFLWVAHEPFIDSFFTATETRQTFAQRIDAASRKDNPGGVGRLELYYLGGDEFRVLVTAGGKFMLNSSTLKIQEFEPDTVLALTISYRTPLGVARLNTTESGGAKVDFKIARGVEALVGVYYEGNGMGDVLALGADNVSGPRFQLAGTVHTVTGDRPVYAIIQLPDESTRAPFSVTMEWTREG